MPAIITLDGLTYRSPDGRTLFEGLTLALGRERTGLVGRNGAGKTSLARLMLGELTPLSGSVAVRGVLGVLRQDPIPAPGAIVADVLGVGEALARLARLEAGEGEEEDLAEADWTLPARLETSLAVVGLAGLDPARSAFSLSGGEATRVALAGLIAREPDMLLLDEPTNNLDAESRARVIQALAEWRGGALVISHDRALLRGMDRIVELSGLGAKVFGGGYELYAERKAQEEAAAARSLDEAQRGLRATEQAVQAASERKARKDSAGKKSRLKRDAPKMALDAAAERAEGTGSRLARTAERQQAEAAQALVDAKAGVERVRRLAFDLPRLGLPPTKVVLTLEGVGFIWPGGLTILAGVNLRIIGPERVAVSGANGAGKTTLLRLAAGDLEPTSGKIRRGVAAARLDQRAALLDDDETLLENFARLNPRSEPHAAHEALARFEFRNVAAQKRAGSLSGGERLRAALACVLCSETPPQLLILDEPTNHLDLQSIEAIEQALAGYDGALLVVSHDKEFLRGVGVQRTLAL